MPSISVQHNKLKTTKRNHHKINNKLKKKQKNCNIIFFKHTVQLYNTAVEDCTSFTDINATYKNILLLYNTNKGKTQFQDIALEDIVTARFQMVKNTHFNIT